ncbi:MAG: cation-transporting P-type ATPase [Anaerolineales bacterium]
MSVQQPAQQKYWNHPPDQLWQDQQSSPGRLSQEESELRLEKYGPNVLKARQNLSPLMLFLAQFESPIVLILIFATLMLVTLIVAVVALLLPYSPLANILGFKPLGLAALGMIVGIVSLYFISAELVKRCFYQRYFIKGFH